MSCNSPLDSIKNMSQTGVIRGYEKVGKQIYRFTHYTNIMCERMEDFVFKRTEK